MPTAAVGICSGRPKIIPLPTRMAGRGISNFPHSLSRLRRRRAAVAVVPMAARRTFAYGQDLIAACRHALRPRQARTVENIIAPLPDGNRRVDAMRVSFHQWTMKVVPATAADIASWLEIVREVEPLFGPMPRFDITLKTKIAEVAAWCVRDGAGAVAGGVLMGGEAPQHWIRWLAVRAAARRRGIGAALLEDVLRRHPGPCTIALATFGDDNPAGRPARRLYARYGFEAREMLPSGPEGGTRQKFVLVRP